MTLSQVTDPSWLFAQFRSTAEQLLLPEQETVPDAQDAVAEQ
ncbi:MAG TPA: hypothetical protein VGG20_22630 [Thermoanaerobaculia bacterium]